MSHHLKVVARSGRAPVPRGLLAAAWDTVRSITLGPYNTKDKALARLFSGEARNLSGVVVNEDTAFNYAAFWQGVGLIAGHLASFPLITYKRLKPAGKTRFTESRLYRLLHDEFNPHMTAFIAREAMQAHALTWGNAYAEIERDPVGRPVALWPLTPDRVTPFHTGAGEVAYRVTGVNQTEVIIPAQDMLHIPGLGFDGLQGYGVVRRARESIGLGMAAERFGAAFFGNGSTFGGALTVPPGADFSDEDEQAVRETLQNFHQGVERAHRFLILHGGLTYTTLGVPPTDAQFLETRKFQVEEIARWLNLPPHKLKHLERSTNNNIEHQGIEYYTDTLIPWLARWEQELNRKLIAPLERNLQFVEHLVDGVLRGDIESRYKAYAIGRQWGWLSANMILEKENMNPIGAEGDMFLVPINMVPADRIDEIIDKQVEKASASAATALPGNQDADRAVDALREQIAALQEAAEAHLARAVAAETRMATWPEEAEALTRTADQARADLQTAQTALAEQQALLAVATEQAQRDAQAREAAEAARAEWARQAGEAVALHQHAVTAREELAAELARLAADLAATTARSAEERAVLEEAHRQATADLEAATAREALLSRNLVEAQEAGVALVAKLTEAEETRDAARTAQVEAEGRAKAAAAQARADADQAMAAAIAARTQAEVARLTTVLAAHRELLLDAMGRIVRQEADKARRHQATPQKLWAWIEAFYSTFDETCVKALQPAIATHLAWRAAPEAPAEVALSLAREHIAESVRQLRAVLDGTDDPDDFAQTLERTLTRWEQDRPKAMADRILRDEVEYVRAYQ